MSMQRTIPKTMQIAAVKELVEREVSRVGANTAGIRNCREIPGVEEFFSLDGTIREQLSIVRNIFELPSNPDLLVRDNFYDIFYEQNGVVCFSPEHVADLLESRRHYDEFSSRVAPVPDFNFVINYGFHGNQQTTPTKDNIPDIFTVVERVHGFRIGNLLFSAPTLSCISLRYGRSIQAEMDHTMANLIRYDDEKIESKEKFATDTGIWQFMYGNTKTNPEKQIFFVDVDNRFARCDRLCDSFELSHPPLDEDIPVEGTFDTLYNKIFLDLVVAVKCIENVNYRAAETRVELKKFVRKYEPAHVDGFYKAKKASLGL